MHEETLVEDVGIDLERIGEVVEREVSRAHAVLAEQHAIEQRAARRAERRVVRRARAALPSIRAGCSASQEPRCLGRSRTWGAGCKWRAQCGRAYYHGAMELLLLSSSRTPAGYLTDYLPEIRAFAGGIRRALFIPFAAVRLPWEEFARRVAEASGFTLDSGSRIRPMSKRPNWLSSAAGTRSSY